MASSLESSKQLDLILACLIPLLSANLHLAFSRKISPSQGQSASCQTVLLVLIYTIS